MSIKVKGALVWIIVFQAIGYLLGRFTQDNVITWYSTLNKSSLTPPDIVFPIVWFILYCMLAVAGYLLWQHRHESKGRLALGFYFSQLLLNWAWTPLFFYFHWVGISLLCLVAIIILTLLTIFIARNTYRLSAILMVPYFIWLLFAGYLNAMVWILNP